ncbi:MAG: serine protease [bacterium]
MFKTTLIMVAALLCFVLLLNCEGQSITDLNQSLMRSTFKFDGKDSIGTVFVMGAPSKDNPSVLRYTLITAAHVLEAANGDEATLHLRVKNGDQFVRRPFIIKIRDHGTNLWIRHPSADVAALRISVPSEVDIKIISTSGIFADDDFIKSTEIHPGDELFALGFPLGSEANEAGFPILRSGAIASYPLIPTADVKTFLFDFQVYRGNSGGPVFIYQMNRLVGAKLPTINICRIMGLVSQEKIITEQVQSLYENRQSQYPIAAAVVVHASLIQETLALLEKSNK